MLNDKQKELCERSRWDFSGLRALFLNCTLKRSPELSHTEGLIGMAQAIMEKNGVSVDLLRPVDSEIPCGVYPDMREHGYKRDDWPEILKTVLKADIVVIGSSIWLGEKTSACTKVIERLYAVSHHLNEHGQYAYYGRVGGCLITGNEDGAKHCAMSILYSLQHLGYVIPPQSDAAWLGEVGPGPSYLDPGSGGPEISPTGTRPLWRGIFSIWLACSRTPAVCRRTEISGRVGMLGADSTMRTRTIARILATDD